jgi:hypothetical protein
LDQIGFRRAIATGFTPIAVILAARERCTTLRRPAIVAGARIFSDAIPAMAAGIMIDIAAPDTPAAIIARCATSVLVVGETVITTFACPAFAIVVPLAACLTLDALAIILFFVASAATGNGFFFFFFDCRVK